MERVELVSHSGFGEFPRIDPHGDTGDDDPRSRRGYREGM